MTLMGLSDVLTLFSSVVGKDKLGVQREIFTPRQVFCRVNSVTRAEFFGAGRNGLNPAYCFTVFAGDYNDEELCEYHGKSYGIYRTYQVPGTDDLELYAERKGGTNGKENTY